MISEQTIRQLAEENLAGTDRFVVEILVKPGNRIYVFIDSDTTVRIDHCAELSRFIEKKLNRDLEDFELNVSSSGIDQPYRLVRQYIKNIGRDVTVQCTDGRKISGKLTAASEGGIEILEQKTVKKIKTDTLYKLAYDEIKETKEIIKF